MTDESATVDLLRASMDANRLNWGDRVAVHLCNRTGFYPIDRVRAVDNDLHWRRDTLAHTRSYEWCHPLSDIIGSLLNAGLHLDFLQTVDGGIAWRETDPRGISTIDS